jgi:hypothetical protein
MLCYAEVNLCAFQKCSGWTEKNLETTCYLSEHPILELEI